MKESTVTLVRVYCSEKDHQYRAVIDLLQREHAVAGVTAFRGIAGFGDSGRVHEAGLLDISLDLPVVVEFFDSPEKVAAVLPLVREMVGPRHVVAWSAQAMLE